MAISDTITSMYENVGNVYDVLELAGADLTNVDKNIENLKQSWEERLLYFLANGTDVVWNNWLPKVNGTGESITLNNTIQAKMDFVYKGNTSQESTTGKNLFSGDYSQFDSQGGTGSTYAYFKLPDDNKQYTLTMIAKNDFTATSNTFLGFTGTGGSGTGGVDWVISQVLGTITKGTILSKTSNSVNRFISLYNKGANYLKNLVDNFDIQLEEGTSSSDYEPYTGGNPAPNPDYPYPVNVVTGDNEVKVEGKNLATENFNSSTTGIALSRTIESGTPIYISSNINNTVNVLYAFMDSTFKGNITVTYSNGKITYSGTPNFTFNRVRCPSDRICTESILALGSTATEYEEHKEQTYPINLGSMELCKIGDYQDYLYKENGIWYKYGAIGKVVYDGTEDGWSSGVIENYHYYKINLPTQKSANNGQGLCDYFLNSYYNYTPGRLRFGWGETALYFYIDISSSQFADLTAWKNWLSTHNTTVYYILGTPTATEITDTTLLSQLEAIKLSYNEQTNISQTNADKPFILDVVALGELEI